MNWLVTSLFPFFVSSLERWWNLLKESISQTKDKMRVRKDVASWQKRAFAVAWIEILTTENGNFSRTICDCFQLITQHWRENHHRVLSGVFCFLFLIIKENLIRWLRLTTQKERKKGKEQKYLFIDNFSFLLFRTFNSEALCPNKNTRKNKLKFFSMFSMVNWTDYQVWHRKSFVFLPHLPLPVNSFSISRDNVFYEVSLDTSMERNSLMQHTYPKLKEYCREKHGLEFQVVDMRWGVRDEATDDHKTTELCMQEIDNCQRVSVGPNFVVWD